MLFLLNVLTMILNVAWSDTSATISISDSFQFIADGDAANKTVSGQITVLPNDSSVDAFLSDSGYGFAIQDETGGIWVFVDDLDFFDDDDKLDQMVYGRWVTVTGTINTANGATERDLGGMVRITPSSFSDCILGELGEPVEPKEISPFEVEDTQGELVKITNVTVTELLIYHELYGSDYLAVHKESGESTSIWYYPRHTEFVEVNKSYQYIIGFASVFIKINASHILEEEWEIWPRCSSDWCEEGAVCGRCEDHTEDSEDDESGASYHSLLVLYSGLMLYAMTTFQ